MLKSYSSPLFSFDKVRTYIWRQGFCFELCLILENSDCQLFMRNILGWGLRILKHNFKLNPDEGDTSY